MKVIGKLRRICNVLNAVTQGAPCSRMGRFIDDNYREHSRIPEHYRLDIMNNTAYTYLHILYRRCRPGSQAQYQSRAPQAAGRLEPASGTSPCPFVPELWVLRCARSRPGEIRDAPAGACRGNEEGCSGSSVWRVSTDLLPDRSCVRATRIDGVTAAAARAEEPPQAHARGDGVHRCSNERRAPAGGRCSGSGDTGGTWPVGPPAQCRARPSTQKKTIAPVVLAELPMPMAAVYEQLRGDVLRGQERPDGLGALVYHGFAEGLRLLCRTTGSMAAAAPRASSPSCAHRDHELLHLLANMVLQTQSEVMHVY